MANEVLNNFATIVLNLLRGAVPERAVELSKYFDRYELEIHLQGGGKAVVTAGTKRIAFSDDMLDAIWLYTFSDWHAIDLRKRRLELKDEVNGMLVTA